MKRRKTLENQKGNEMTVRELRELLATMEDDMTVVFEDSWTRDEGWRPGHEKATFEVTGIIINDDGDCELVTES